LFVCFLFDECIDDLLGLWSRGTYAFLVAWQLACALFQQPFQLRLGLPGCLDQIKEKEMRFSIYDDCKHRILPDAHSAPACHFKGLKKGGKNRFIF
jgi:hypothetical protein